MTFGPRPAKDELTGNRTYRRWVWVILLASGTALLLAMQYVASRSIEFQYGSPMLDRPIPVFVATTMIAGGVYLVAALVIMRHAPGWSGLIWIIPVGVGMRWLLLGSTPILENDYYRYLWDGGVVAAGYNPFAYMPQEVLAHVDRIPQDVIALARESGDVALRIGHPQLGTVYPPVAQAFFGIAHVIEPWSLEAWRSVLLTVDAAVCLLLLVSLHLVGRPPSFVLIYWWNPLLVTETVNSAHMDVLILPFVLIAFIAAVRKMPVLTFAAGALAVCTKVWPALLAPPLARYLRARWDRLAIAAIIGAGIALAVASPMYAAMEHGDNSGFAAYSERWEMNDALFMVVHAGVGQIDRAFGGTGFGKSVDSWARGAVAAILIALCAALTISPARDPQTLANRLAILTGALFMLSPTQFPWYFVWMLPFLAIAPRASLLTLTVMLPMYYLKFYYVAQGEADYFHNRVVWIEYAPVLALIAWEAVAALTHSARQNA